MRTRQRFKCPRRAESANLAGLPEWDHWVRRDGTRVCTWCGSMHPDLFMQACRDGEEIGPTDKSYKVYVGVSGKVKFYFQHLGQEQRAEFVDRYNTLRVNIGYPGYLYVPPFFTYTYPAPSRSDGG